MSSATLASRTGRRERVTRTSRSGAAASDGGGGHRRVRLGHSVARPRVRPSGRTASTARKTRWPARIPRPASICAPTVCATPSTMPPDQRAPDRADAADDDGLEGEQEPAAAGARRERRVHAEGQAREGNGRERDGRRDPEDVPVVGTRELRRLAIVRHGPDETPRAGARQEVLQAQQHDHGHHEDEQADVGDGEVRPSRRTRPSRRSRG